MPTQPVLTTAVQYNLRALQNHDALMQRTQERLATGLRVNRASDDTAAYFTARTFDQTSKNITEVVNDMALSESLLKTTITALESAMATLDQMRALAKDSKSLSAAADRTAAAGDYNSLKAHYVSILSDGDHNGSNLLDNTNNLSVALSHENTAAVLTLTGSDFVGNPPADAAGNWATNANIDAAITALDTQETALRNKINTFSHALSTLNIRTEFLNDIKIILDVDVQNLTGADINKEGANLASLQTSQQLAIASLQISSTTNQSVLRLFA